MLIYFQPPRPIFVHMGIRYCVTPICRTQGSTPWILRSADRNRLGQLLIRAYSCDIECPYGLLLLSVLRSDEHVHHQHHELGTRIIQGSY